MKRYWILLAFLSLPVLILAQHISVASFRALPLDMTARITDPVKDQNGDKCALIKVVTTETGFAWEGGMLGVMKAEKKKGEYWVYVPYGAKKLTIKHDKLGVLRNYLYTEPIEEAAVYEMVLTTGKVTTIVSGAQIQKQWLVILSEPAGAAVYINNQLQSSLTPFQKKLDLGKYTYRLEYANYHNETGVIELGSESKQELNIKLKPAFGSLSVTSTPEGADVMVDGKPTGLKCPCTINELASGQHELRLIKEMYSPFLQQFTIKDGEITELNIPLDANFGMVHIQTDPEADIYIDGELVAKGQCNERVVVGNHNIEARRRDYYSDFKSISVQENEQVKVFLSPIAKTGSFDIQSIPIGASVYVDGVLKGETPIIITGLLKGQHSISLEKFDYATIEKQIFIIEDSIISGKEIMRKGEEIIVDSYPAGLNIFVDNKNVGKTPWIGNLAYGNYVLKVINEEIEWAHKIDVASDGDCSYILNFSIFDEFRMQLESRARFTDHLSNEYFNGEDAFIYKEGKEFIDSYKNNFGNIRDNIIRIKKILDYRHNYSGDSDPILVIQYALLTIATCLNDDVFLYYAKKTNNDFDKNLVNTYGYFQSLHPVLQKRFQSNDMPSWKLSGVTVEKILEALRECNQ